MFNYKPDFIPTNFVVIGAGGTGGRLVPLLAQFLKTANWIQNPKIYVVDHDIVEEKNLVRQNFIKLDLNKAKAVVLAERYGKAFDLNIVPVVKQVQRLEKQDGQLALDNAAHADHGTVRVSLATIRNAVIVMCVDSAKARHDILSHLLSPGIGKNLLILDAGNENDFGQIVIFNDSCYVVPSAFTTRESIQKLPLKGGLLPFNADVSILPVPIAFYNDLKDLDAKSCADLDQTLAINATMATFMMGIIQNLLYDKPIPFNKVNIGLTSGAIPELMTLKSIEDAIFSTNDVRTGKTTSKVPLPRLVDPTRVLNLVALKMKEFNDGNVEEKKQENVQKKVIQNVSLLSGDGQPASDLRAR